MAEVTPILTRAQRRGFVWTSAQQRVLVVTFDDAEQAEAWDQMTPRAALELLVEMTRQDELVQPDAQCRSCRAPIAWVETVKGKRMPLDPDPVEDGNVWVIRLTDERTPVVGVALNADGVPPLVRLRYQSHFVSCPDRDSWRKR